MTEHASPGNGSRLQKEDSVAEKEDFDSTHSGDSAADPGSVEAHGAHAIEPAVDGVPAEVDEPTFRDRERMLAEDDRELSSLEERDGSTDDETLAEGAGDKELVTVGAARQGRESGAGELTPAVGRGRDKKVKATPRQKQVEEKEHRTGPVTFVRESIGELQKVVYPTGQQLITYFIVVLVFVLFIIAIVSLLDLAFGKAILAVFS